MTAASSRPSLRAGERGMALVSALLLLLVMSGLALALTTSGRIEVAMGDNEELYAGARAAAESGLNHAAAMILQQTNNPTFPLNNLLAGPDTASDPNNQAAAVNADNGLITHLMPGSAACAANGALPCWPVVAGSNYSYTVRLFDDDDPVMSRDPATGFNPTELAAMGPPPDPAEDGNRFNDINRRLVIRATGFGPRGTQAVLEQMLTPIKMPALLVDGDLTLGGDARVAGSQGSVHANGDLVVEGDAVLVERNATASGTVVAGEDWEPGELESGGMPRVPAPDIHAADHFADADFVLQADGRITSPAGSTSYCDASSDGQACRGVTPPGGTAPFGWTYDAATGWDLSEGVANAATYYVKGDVRITGSVGTAMAPVALTIVAEGNIDITGNPSLRSEPASELLFVTDKDLRCAGDATVPVVFEGRVLVREQVEMSGQPTITGQVVVQSVPSVSPLVEVNAVRGSVRLSFSGQAETLAFTVSGWREIP